MALRDQPYLPLYIQDVLTDEKLMECSASAHGIYFRLLCILHKQEDYGKIKLKAKHKQNESNIMNFAYMLDKHLPFSRAEISSALTELIDEKVLYLEKDTLFQKRMVRDFEISEERAKSGAAGGKKSRKSSVKNSGILPLQEVEIIGKQNVSKTKANSEYEYEYINTLSNDEKKLKFINWVMSVFEFNEIKNADKFREVNVFCNILIKDDKMGYFIEQFKAYIQFKKQSAEKFHSFPKFIGTIESRYLDGGWNARNWVKELEKINAPQTPKLPPLKPISR